MTFQTLLSIMLVGIITGNVFCASGMAVDVAGNQLNTIKGSLIYSLFIFGTLLLSGVVIFVTNLILGGKYFVFVVVLVVAIMVQIAEFLMEKFFPIIHTKLGRFIVALIPTLTIILFSLFTQGLTFGVLLLNIIFICVGITLVLALISGIRNNKLTYSSDEVFKGNLMTLVILFVLALVWTAL